MKLEEALSMLRNIDNKSTLSLERPCERSSSCSPKFIDNMSTVTIDDLLEDDWEIVRWT